MSQVCVSLPLFILLSFRLIYGYPGDTVMVMPRYEMRAVDSYPPQTYTSPFQRPKQQEILHTDVIQKKPAQSPMIEKQSNQNTTFGQFIEAINELSRHQEEQFHPRISSTAGRDDSQSYSTLPRPTGYSRPNYASPVTYNESPSMQRKVPLLKPDLSGLLVPAPNKVSNKLSGLLGLLTLLNGAGSGGLELSGFKDIFLNGIMKPLLVAKGGLKVIISKLAIPVIALVLINIEVLFVVWWMWEDCPAIVEPTPSYDPPPPYPKPSYNYNSYR